jgi:hypothetical protein
LKKLRHFQQIREMLVEINKGNNPNDKHVHVVYSNGEWGNRQWQYRVYPLPKKNAKDIKAHLRLQPHHANLAKNGWHVETAVVADRKDMDKTQNKLNKHIIKHAETDAKLRKRLTAAEKPPEKKTK